MSETKGPSLHEIVESLYDTLNGKDDDYISVIITVLIGGEEEVVEAEMDLDHINHDSLPCKNAKVKLSDYWNKCRD